MNKRKTFHKRKEQYRAYAIFLTTMIKKVVSSNKTGLAIRDTPSASFEGATS